MYIQTQIYKLGKLHRFGQGMVTNSYNVNTGDRDRKIKDQSSGLSIAAKEGQSMLRLCGRPCLGEKKTRGKKTNIKSNNYVCASKLRFYCHLDENEPCQHAVVHCSGTEILKIYKRYYGLLHMFGSLLFSNRRFHAHWRGTRRKTSLLLQGGRGEKIN